MPDPLRTRLRVPQRVLRRAACFLVVLALVAWANWANAQAEATATPADQPTRLTTTQQLQLEHLLQDLDDPKLTLERRRTAAIILVDDAWPQATRSLRHLLNTAADGTARAIAQALAMAVTVPPDLLTSSLLDRLSTPDALLRQDIALALARYPSEGVLDKLVTLAADPLNPIDHRLGAIQALGSHRTRRAVAALLDLAQTQQVNIPPAAFESLARLTGLSHLGQNVLEWQRWWRQVEDLPEERWLAELMRNITAHAAVQSGQIAVLTQRIIDKNDQLYDSTDETNRPAILKQMLTDALTPVRLQALSLIERRILNAQPVAEDIRQSMLQLLTDPNPDVRAATTRQFDRLDEPPVGLIVELLLEESESDPKVLAAQLTLLAHHPQPEAVAPALYLLWEYHPGVRTASARFISAALDADLLLDGQIDGAHAAAQFQITQHDPPDIQMIHLLGQIGRDEDRPLFAGYLQHNNAAVRLAAAQAFASNAWPTEPLLSYIDDETLAPAVIETLGARAADADSLIALLDAEPKLPQALPAWRAAQGAVASRLSTDDLVLVDTHLIDQAALLETHESILKAAAGLTHNTEPDPLAEPRRTEAFFLLGELYQRTQQPAKAEDIYKRIGARNNLTPENTRRLAVAHMSLLLDTKQFDNARQIAATQLEANPEQAADDIAAPWLDLAEEAVQQDRAREAVILSQQIKSLFGSRLDELNTLRLAQLLRQLGAESSSAPTGEPAQAAAPQ